LYSKILAKVYIRSMYERKKIFIKKKKWKNEKRKLKKKKKRKKLWEQLTEEKLKKWSGRFKYTNYSHHRKKSSLIRISKNIKKFNKKKKKRFWKFPNKKIKKFSKNTYIF
jgi:hypothetical protein